MKGIVFNITEKFVCTTYGEELWFDTGDEVKLQIQEPFVGPGTYPDEDLVALILHVCKKTETPLSSFFKQLGAFTFSGLAGRNPEFLEGFNHPKSFLQSVNDIVHVEVNKLYNHAYFPTFKYEDNYPNELIIIYHSKRKLYDFMDGLIQGVALHFNTTIRTSQRIFDENGEEFCEFNLVFEA